MESLPGWVISPMPGPPPRQDKRERQYTPSTHSVIPNKADMEWWLWLPNDIRGPWGPKVSRHSSYRWGKTPKKPHPGDLSRPGTEPGPAVWQARMLPPGPLRWTKPFNILVISRLGTLGVYRRLCISIVVLSMFHLLKFTDFNFMIYEFDE